MGKQDIELIDYLRVSWKRKWLIIGGALTSTIVVLIGTLYLPKTYEVSRTLMIGQVQKAPIETRELVVDRLTDRRLLATIGRELQLNNTPEEVAKKVIVLERKDNPHVRLVVRESDPVLATRIADALVEKIMAIHKPVFDSKMEIVRAREAEAIVAVQTAKADLQRAKKNLENVVKGPQIDASAVFLFEGFIEERERNVEALRRHLAEIRLSLLPPESQNTIVVAADTLPRWPIRPKVELNVVLGGILSLVIFALIAFFLEYLERAGERGAAHGKGQ